MARAIILAMSLLQVAAARNIYFARLMPVESDGPMGWVAVAVTRDGLVGAGEAKGLEPKLRASPGGANCTASNGCGTHVHSGTACTNSSTQGGHYFDSNATDPWSPVGYTFTTRGGRALFTFAVQTAGQDIVHKPFIIHNNAGARVACGLLDPVLSGRLSKRADDLLGLSAAHVLGLKPSVEDVEEYARAHRNDIDHIVAEAGKAGSHDEKGHAEKRAVADPDKKVPDKSHSAASIEDDDFDAKKGHEEQKKGGITDDKIRAAFHNVFFAQLMPLQSSGPKGLVAVAITREGQLVGAGVAKGLEHNLRAPPKGTNCTAANGCGAHVHSGTACTDASTQGGHYFAPNSTDPWSSVGYAFTTRRGRTVFKFALETKAQDVQQKPFILHDNSGARVACGILAPVANRWVAKHAGQLLSMKQLGSVEDIVEDEHGLLLPTDDLDGEDDEDDEDDDEDDDDDDEDKHDDHDRRLAATTILI